jgi:hypothetical protein
VTLEGIVIDFREVHSENIFLPIVFRVLDKVTDTRAEQATKTRSPTVTTVFGSTMAVREVQPEKA